VLAKSDLALTIDLINKCLEIKNRDSLRELKDTLSNELGVSSLIVAHVSRQTNNETAYFFGVNEEWGRLYRESDYSLIDPVYKLALKSETPVLWSDAYSQASDYCSEFIERAKGFNLVEGICYAQMDHSITSATTVASVGAGKTPLTCLQIEILTQILPHISEILGRHSLWNYPRLTPTEMEVIKWSARGKSYWESSLIMSISERTVKFHMNNICKKLDVVNKTQAVARCLSLGYISV
jgi:DNA-binding CsgD family transcriptional regulator